IGRADQPKPPATPRDHAIRGLCAVSRAAPNLSRTTTAGPGHAVRTKASICELIVCTLHKFLMVIHSEFPILSHRFRSRWARAMSRRRRCRFHRGMPKETGATPLGGIVLAVN